MLVVLDLSVEFSQLSLLHFLSVFSFSGSNIALSRSEPSQEFFQGDSGVTTDVHNVENVLSSSFSDGLKLFLV